MGGQLSLIAEFPNQKPVVLTGIDPRSPAGSHPHTRAGRVLCVVRRGGRSVIQIQFAVLSPTTR